MEKIGCYENYPLSTVAAANLHSISIYVIGAVILSGFGLVVPSLFIAYCAAMEINVYRSSCVNCYYYGKVCFSGRGKVSALLFNRGDAKSMAEREITWMAILPDFLTAGFPLVGGAVLLLTSFSWLTIILMAAILFLSLAGNALLRGRLACKYCKQRELGCPAEKLFQKRAGTKG